MCSSGFNYLRPILYQLHANLICICKRQTASAQWTCSLQVRNRKLWNIRTKMLEGMQCPSVFVQIAVFRGKTATAWGICRLSAPRQIWTQEMRARDFCLCTVVGSGKTLYMKFHLIITHFRKRICLTLFLMLRFYRKSHSIPQILHGIWRQIPPRSSWYSPGSRLSRTGVVIKFHVFHCRLYWKLTHVNLKSSESIRVLVLLYLFSAPLGYDDCHCAQLKTIERGFITDSEAKRLLS